MFTNESFSFLADLEKNNNKNWFEKNRTTYQNSLIKPIKNLIDDLDLFTINHIDNNLETKPVINKAISRIYRDTRFSNNKLPFKNHIGFNFRRKNYDWKYYPSFFFRIIPIGYIFGLGVMKNSPNKFNNLREKINLDIKGFYPIIKPIDQDNDFEILGDNYKKYKLNPSNKDNQNQINNELINSVNKIYCKKNIFIKCFKDKNFYHTQQDLVIDIENKFTKLIGLYKFIKNVF